MRNKKTISFCMDKDLVVTIKNRAKRENRSVSNLIETAIIDYICKCESKAKAENSHKTA